MAKTIKFNLMMDNNPVRTIADLQENFSIEDALKYFKNGLLAKWLSVRGFDSYYDKIKDIDIADEDKKIITQLIKVFDIELDDKKIELAIEILNYLNEEKELNAIYKDNSFKQKQIIEDYHSGYDAIIRHMIDAPKNAMPRFFTTNSTSLLFTTYSLSSTTFKNSA